MTVQLDEEQTKFWKKRTLYQFLMLGAIVVVAIFLQPMFGDTLILLTMGGYIGAMLFVITMPTIKYYVEYADDGDEQSEKDLS